jgi:hypothetical protein
VTTLNAYISFRINKSTATTKTHLLYPSQEKHDMASANRSAASPANAAQCEVRKSGERMLKYEADTARYAITAPKIVLSTESQSEFEEIRDAYYRRFQPANQFEADLVFDMIAAHWSLRRTSTIKTQTINAGQNRRRSVSPASRGYISQPVRAGRAFEKNSDTLRRYSRRENALDRNFDNTAATLRGVQEDRVVLSGKIAFEKNVILQNEGKLLAEPKPSASTHAMDNDTYNDPTNDTPGNPC